MLFRSDVALFVGIQKVLIDRHLVDYDYLRAHTQDWEAIVEQARSTDWETIVSTCGVSQAEIEAVAIAIGTAPKVVFAWAMGIT